MPSIVIIENEDIPISQETKDKIYNRYPNCKYETISNDTRAYKRTLTNRFDIAFIDVNFEGKRFDAFDIVRGCVLSGKPVVIIRHSKNGKCNTLKCEDCDKSKECACSIVEACHVTTWNDFEAIEDVTSDCPLNCKVNLNTIFEQLKK
jgi:hypothetical protein